MYYPYDNNYLAHYGVLGMRWGVRRYQPYPKGHKGGKEIGEARRKFLKRGQRDLNDENIKEFKKIYSNLRHVKIGANTSGKVFVDGDNLIGVVNTERKDDGNIWIQGLEIFGQNKGKGYGKNLLDVAVKDLGATHLSVRKTNNIAKHMYDEYGFNVYDEDSYMYYMKINKSKV